jgi:ribonucleoside-diphosphate reductase subunit M2
MKPLKPESKPVKEEEEEEEDFDTRRLRFVGEVDLPESEEPLLKESKRRFVLFPIQYNEVRTRVDAPLLLADRFRRSG